MRTRDIGVSRGDCFLNKTYYYVCAREDGFLHYEVKLERMADGFKLSCSCPDWEARYKGSMRGCSHIRHVAKEYLGDVYSLECLQALAR